MRFNNIQLPRNSDRAYDEFSNGQRWNESTRYLARYREAGVDELVIVESPPAEPERVDSWIDGLAMRWLAPAARPT